MPQPDRDRTGERVVWADDASAFAIHRVRPGRSQALRTSRLGTGSVSDGSVAVSPGFYEQVVQKVVGGVRSVAYVLPEPARPAEFMAALDQP